MLTSKNHYEGKLVSTQIMARRAIVVRSNQTRSGVAVDGFGAFDVAKPRDSNQTRPRSMMLTLISAVAAVWSLLTLFGHY